MYWKKEKNKNRLPDKRLEAINNSDVLIIIFVDYSLVKSYLLNATTYTLLYRDHDDFFIENKQKKIYSPKLPMFSKFGSNQQKSFTMCCESLINCQFFFYFILHLYSEDYFVNGMYIAYKIIFSMYLTKKICCFFSLLNVYVKKKIIHVCMDFPQ